MMDSGLLLVATMAVPLAMVVACFHPAFYERILTWLPLAAVPGLLAALLERGDSIVIAPAPLRLTLALDEVGAMLLGGASLLWGAAGFYASIALRGRPGVGRFAIWWLLTLTGSLGVFIVADMTSFYLVFSLAKSRRLRSRLFREHRACTACGPRLYGPCARGRGTHPVGFRHAGDSDAGRQPTDP